MAKTGLESVLEFVMTDTNYKEDDVLKRMLSTPPKKNEPTTPLGKRRRQDREKVDK
tara:strand:+ start:1187 stop:1354 length:168 start_codon:yes stop_codon:yes gene_type:complete